MPRKIVKGPSAKELMSALFYRAKGAKQVMFTDDQGSKIHCTVSSVEATGDKHQWNITGWNGTDCRYRALYSTKTHQGELG